MLRCANGDGRRAHRRGLCRCCWEAARKEEGPSARGGKVELGAVDVPPEMARGLEALAARLELPLAEVRRRAYREKLDRER